MRSQGALPVSDSSCTVMVELGGVRGYGTEHRCRDWDSLLGWISRWEAYKKDPSSEGKHEGVMRVISEQVWNSILARKKCCKGESIRIDERVFQPHNLIFFYYTIGCRIHKHLPVYALMN